jgi:hypothetical protein
MCWKSWNKPGIEYFEALYEWSDKWQRNFNVDKCKEMHFGARNVKAEYKIDELKLAETTEEQDLVPNLE